MQKENIKYVGDTFCQRCSSENAKALRNNTHAILACGECGFDMGTPLA